MEALKKNKYISSYEIAKIIDASTSNETIKEVLTFLLDNKNKSKIMMDLSLIRSIVNKGYHIPPASMEKLLNRMNITIYTNTADKYSFGLHGTFDWIDKLIISGYQFTDKSMFYLFDTKHKHVEEHFKNKLDINPEEVSLVLNNVKYNTELLIKVLQKTALPPVTNAMCEVLRPNTTYENTINNLKLLLITVMFEIEFNTELLLMMFPLIPMFKFNVLKNYMEKGIKEGKVTNLSDFKPLFALLSPKKKQRKAYPRGNEIVEHVISDDLDNDTTIRKIDNLCCEKTNLVINLITELNDLDNYLQSYFTKRATDNDKLTTMLEKNIICLLNLAKKYNISSYNELNDDVKTKNNELVSLLSSFSNNAITLHDLESVCLEGSYAKYKLIFDSVGTVNETCLLNATTANSLEIVKDILQTKIDIPQSVIGEIRSQEMVNTYIDFGMQVNYDVIKKLSKRNLFVSDLNKFDIAYDINIYVLYYKKASYRNKICYYDEFKKNVSMLMDIRDMINKTKKSTDETIIEQIKKNKYVDLPMYNDALRFQRDTLASYMENELKITKNVYSCLMISDYDKRMEYMDQIEDKNLVIDDKVNLFI
ncbi:MAG: hypothetical protein Terrestrivirus4_181 [Terrestrivirus sp.]|uniref:Uncharacterized protein n=1 Tax=Terrestrivirus sp. TaxID=2487775 RepID=A0A3G4ZRB4_9VIRU|nr:MAG: hypothetical protein Terrestrivirus4_181 [Terrestrivirus sp.]